MFYKLRNNEFNGSCTFHILDHLRHVSREILITFIDEGFYASKYFWCLISMKNSQIIRYIDLMVKKIKSGFPSVNISFYEITVY